VSKIITTPNPILRKISKPVVNLDKKNLAIVRDIQDTLSGSDHPRGVGLSGVQIGKTIRVFCVYLPKSGDPDDEKSQPILSTFINPEVVEVSKDKTLGPKKEKPILEGCLSIPGIWGPVWRHSWIRLRYTPFLSKNAGGEGDKFSLAATARPKAWQNDQRQNPMRAKPSAAKKISVAKPTEKIFSAFPARVIQHELDHLNGILFTDHSLRDKLPIYESRDNGLVEVEII